MWNYYVINVFVKHKKGLYKMKGFDVVYVKWLWKGIAKGFQNLTKSFRITF